VLAVDALQAQVATFTTLVLDLLEISRFDAGAARLELSDVDVVALARSVLDEAGSRDVPVVPDQEKLAVFERFGRGLAARRATAPGGTGLGLALVQDHAALHGGRAWVEDGTSGGARFVVEIPEGRP
jgi:signal transduction histidine kinase